MVIAVILTIGLPLAATPASASDARLDAPQLVQLWELSTPIGGYFYTTSEVERDSAIQDHGFGPAGVQAARYISRTEFPGSVALHRLRAVGRASYILALPAEAATLAGSGDFVDEGVLGYVDEDGHYEPPRLPTGERLAGVWRISKAGAWRAANMRVVSQYCWESPDPWHLDGLLTSAWALEGA
ncbi:hypothetical protein [Nonomuraea sp. NPDC049480]|uniref:hypothetical protein n=1 Tax=Nonomuraea sp. NPDC049480 TaxID=3364353 RepID=UPI0037A7D51B